MKRAFLILALVTMPALEAQAAPAQTPISITMQNPFQFGRFAVTTGGSVTLTPAGGRTASGGVFLLSSPAWSAASFLVTGKKNQPFVITLPSTVTLSNGSQTMTVSNLTSTPSGSGFFPYNGFDLKVGGRLNVNGNQAPGAYSGTLDVTVNYP
ncbi:MAG: DUF4402 domain-containing protein [Bacteroidota bacterium]